ncbi:hypothetical protein M378DRAFT_17305 [Amanita muscaria Koide BX008]|uniref:Uncharacterized protein n=1 Tax=Amanita muscaria (strain Koide BX008) TaxID=946122 RepID=A0A0C2WJ65_AMAMK|nr:hypothetical protein M378DRAFT_17305 [Amanita muscaria Koide BX008]
MSTNVEVEVIELDDDDDDENMDESPQKRIRKPSAKAQYMAIKQQLINTKKKVIVPKGKQQLKPDARESQSLKSVTKANTKNLKKTSLVKVTLPQTNVVSTSEDHLVATIEEDDADEDGDTAGNNDKCPDKESSTADNIKVISVEDSGSELEGDDHNAGDNAGSEDEYVSDNASSGDPEDNADHKVVNDEEWPLTPKAKSRENVAQQLGTVATPWVKGEDSAGIKKLIVSTKVGAGKNAQVGKRSQKQKGLTKSQMLYPADCDIPSDSYYDHQDDFVPVDTDLMPLSAQDKKLQLDYTTVPSLSYAEMLPFGYNPNYRQGTERYSAAWAALLPTTDKECRRWLRAAVRFQHCLPLFPFLNPSRAEPGHVLREGSRLVLKDDPFKKQTAVFLTTGIVQQCQLVQPCWGGTNGSYQVRCINLSPFSIEYERTMAMFGHAFGLDTFMGPLTDGNLVFGTRREGAGNTPSTPTPTTPTRCGRVPMRFKNAGAASRSYPDSLGFNEFVPIYDA